MRIDCVPVSPRVYVDRLDIMLIEGRATSGSPLRPQGHRGRTLELAARRQAGNGRWTDRRTDEGADCDGAYVVRCLILMFVRQETMLGIQSYVLVHTVGGNRQKHGCSSIEKYRR